MEADEILKRIGEKFLSKVEPPKPNETDTLFRILEQAIGRENAIREFVRQIQYLLEEGIPHWYIIMNVTISDLMRYSWVGLSIRLWEGRWPMELPDSRSRALDLAVLNRLCSGERGTRIVDEECPLCDSEELVVRITRKIGEQLLAFIRLVLKPAKTYDRDSVVRAAEKIIEDYIRFEETGEEEDDEE
jgi:hypothetical protein